MHAKHHIVGQKWIRYECIHSVPIWYARVAKYTRQIPAGSTDRPCPVLDVHYIPCSE